MINPFLTYAKNPDMPDTALGSMDTAVNKHGSCHDSLARRTILILSMGALYAHTYTTHTHIHTRTHTCILVFNLLRNPISLSSGEWLLSQVQGKQKKFLETSI